MSPNTNSALPIPTEIPWQLANTTQPLFQADLGPDNTVISMFTYIPTLDTLDTDYPDDRLIYLKFTVSISPNFLFNKSIPQPTDPLSLFTDAALPVWRLLFDVKISPRPYATGGIKPYFLAAAPMRRAMLETGVVGQQASEGASKSLAVGKSGSQMNETYASLVDTEGGSGGVSGPFGSVSSDSSNTTTIGSRQVTQNVDSTQRDASTERKELVSHMTNVSNVLTLLSAFDVGSPYLRFSLWQRPLQPLVIDPLDPSLWYAELLRRRSSGIEGIQEFYAIACIPRDLGGYCIEAELRRFSIILPPLPDGKDLEMPGGDAFPTDSIAAQVEDYLHRRYPRGTPVDELDVEPGLPAGAPKPNRPTIQNWQVALVEDLVGQTFIAAPGAVVGADLTDFLPGRFDLVGGPGGFATYKTVMEVWLDMKRDEYEQKLMESPLSAGSPVFSLLTLNTCFGSPGIQTVLGGISSKAPSFGAWPTQIQTPPNPSFSNGGRKLSAYRQAAFAWNAAENHFGALLSQTSRMPAQDLRFDHPKIVDAALQRMAQLEPDDPANQSLDQVRPWFGLSSAQIVEMSQQGVVDARGLARAIQLAPAIDRMNRRSLALPRTGARSNSAASSPPPTTTLPPPLLSVEAASELRRTFGATLHASFARQQPLPDRKDC